MNEQKMTITTGEALQMVINNLGQLNIPVSMLQQIGIPIAQSITILQDVYKVMEENEKKAAENPDDIKVELLSEPKDAEGEDNNA